MFKKIPGTKDILPEEVYLWQKLENIGRNIFSLYNYQEIRPPLIEDVALFNRSLGESTEIVQKQMFLIPRQDEVYALRPEGTASVVRAYIENNLGKTQGLLKLYYLGPMFRCERPQKGRLRQFHHLGCEVLGSDNPAIDTEVISLAGRLLREIGVSGYKIRINSLGCPKDKNALVRILRRDLKAQVNELCDDCKVRFERNVLRVLDCKNESCRNVVRSLNIKDNFLCPDCKGNYDRVLSGLDALKIDYQIDPFLVRGLDYYTRTVFEITHSGLGSQDALCAGGRYNGLIQQLGGPDVGAIGFAFGIERVLLVTRPTLMRGCPERTVTVYLIALGDEARKEGLKILNDLRTANIPADTDYENKSLKGAMRRANDLKARFVLILGEEELKKKVVTLKDMGTGEQREIKQSDILKELQDKSQITNPKSQTNPNTQ